MATGPSSTRATRAYRDAQESTLNRKVRCIPQPHASLVRTRILHRSSSLASAVFVDCSCHSPGLRRAGASATTSDATMIDTLPRRQHRAGNRRSDRTSLAPTSPANLEHSSVHLDIKPSGVAIACGSTTTRARHANGCRESQRSCSSADTATCERPIEPSLWLSRRSSSRSDRWHQCSPILMARTVTSSTGRHSGRRVRTSTRLRARHEAHNHQRHEAHQAMRRHEATQLQWHRHEAAARPTRHEAASTLQ